MFKGDRSRKNTLSDYGFRLPSCKDNRPLMFEEWERFKSQTIYVSATPGEYELEKTSGVFIEQIVRPTGLVDPICEVRKASNQVEDVIEEVLHDGREEAAEADAGHRQEPEGGPGGA